MAHLRKHKLVEGRADNLYLAAPLARSDDEKAKYIKNKGLITRDADSRKKTNWIIKNDTNG